MSERDLDLVVFGASGFVGRLVAGQVAEYLDGRLAEPGPNTGVRVGLAGRSRERLTAVRAELGPAAADWTLVVADVDDPESVREMAGRTRVLASTVGPYHRYGRAVVGACAEAGTHYLDLAGEVLFVRDCIDRFDAVARATGARLVNSCGFDSVPSDLGVLITAAAARADGAGALTDTALVVRSVKGGFSGGTVDSLRTQIDAVRADRSLRRIVADPYSLSPDRAAEPDPGDGRDGIGIRHDTELGTWTAPFVMGAYNTRIVRRSNALQNWVYGRRFRYREVMATGTGIRGPLVAAGLTVALGGAVAGLSQPIARRALDRWLPTPGTGPSESARRRGHFRMHVDAHTESGARYVATVAGRGDPGYAATAVMFGQAALALVLDEDRLPPTAGVLTPATALGSVLVDRLRASGLELSVARPD